MKIGVNALFLIPGEVGGSETYLTETLKALLACHPEMELVLFTNEECDASLRALVAHHQGSRCECIRIRATNRYARIIAEQTVLPRRARVAGVDVLWSPGYTAPMLTRIPQVVSILDMQYRSHPEDLATLARWTTHVLVSGAARRARRILAISEFSKAEITRHTGVPSDRIDVTHLGVDPAFGRTRDAVAEHTLRANVLGFEEPYLLCVANSYPHKNVHTLVEAFTAIASECSHRLVLVGKPRLGEPLVQQALARAPAGRIRRLERVERAELIALYQAADIFVFPSLYEGFGLPVLEALAAGVPVVTTRNGSLSEVGGGAVLYADGRSAGDISQHLRRVLHWDPVTRSAAIATGLVQAAQFTWTNTAQATYDTLQRALK